MKSVKIAAVLFCLSAPLTSALAAGYGFWSVGAYNDGKAYLQRLESNLSVSDLEQIISDTDMRDLESALGKLKFSSMQIDDRNCSMEISVGGDVEAVNVKETREALSRVARMRCLSYVSISAEQRESYACGFSSMTDAEIKTFAYQGPTSTTSHTTGTSREMGIGVGGGYGRGALGGVVGGGLGIGGSRGSSESTTRTEVSGGDMKTDTYRASDARVGMTCRPIHNGGSFSFEAFRNKFRADTVKQLKLALQRFEKSVEEQIASANTMVRQLREAGLTISSIQAQTQKCYDARKFADRVWLKAVGQSSTCESIGQQLSTVVTQGETDLRTLSINSRNLDTIVHNLNEVLNNGFYHTSNQSQGYVSLSTGKAACVAQLEECKSGSFVGRAADYWKENGPDYVKKAKQIVNDIRK